MDITTFESEEMYTLFACVFLSSSLVTGSEILCIHLPDVSG